MNSGIDVLYLKRRQVMIINIEMIPSYKIAYIRRIGSYGSENVKIMEQLKNWAREKNLLNAGSIILGIAQDNPKFTEPKDLDIVATAEKCRIESLDKEINGFNFKGWFIFK